MPIVDPPDWSTTCHHEAGHTVAALAAGAHIQAVDMMAHPPHVDARWRSRSAPLDLAAFSLAGYVAEVLAGYDRPAFAVLDLDDLGHDGREAANTITAHDLDAAEVIHRAAHLIATHRRAVCDLAAILGRVDQVPGWILTGWWSERTQDPS